MKIRSSGSHGLRVCVSFDVVGAVLQSFCSWMCDSRALVVYGSQGSALFSAAAWRLRVGKSMACCGLRFDGHRVLLLESCFLWCPHSRVGKTPLSILCDDSGEFGRCAPTGVALLSLHNFQELMNQHMLLVPWTSVRHVEEASPAF